MKVQHFFDKDTATFTYVISDPSTNKCAIVDSVLDYNMYSGSTSTHSADRIITYVRDQKLTVEWILETHIHADHLTASQYLKQHLGGKIAIGERITDVFKAWIPLFHTHNDTPCDGSQFDHLFQNNETFSIGNIDVNVMHTPGHTPACVTYVMGDCAFIGDTLFMPHIGTARTDFPGGSAQNLYQSIQKILSLPESTKLYMCHDYPASGDVEKHVITVGEQRQKNTMIHDGVSEESYITARDKKDKGKDVPRLLLPSIQINMRAGDLGAPEDNNIQYIKIPLNQMKS